MARQRLLSRPAMLGLLVTVGLALLLGFGYAEAIRRRKPSYLMEVAQPWIEALEAHREATGTFPVQLDDVGIEIDPKWRYGRDGSGVRLSWGEYEDGFVLSWTSDSGWSVIPQG